MDRAVQRAHQDARALEADSLRALSEATTAEKSSAKTATDIQGARGAMARSYDEHEDGDRGPHGARRTGPVVCLRIQKGCVAAGEGEMAADVAASGETPAGA